MITLLLIWVGVCAALMFIGTGRRRSAGLPLAYFLGLSLIHTPGALLYLGSGTWQSNANLTQIGFEQTVIGMVAFTVGVVLARNVTFAHGRRETSFLPAAELVESDKLALWYLGVGVLSYLGMIFLGRIPSVASVVAALGSLMIVGVCLRLWVAQKAGDAGKWLRTAALVPLFPLVTMIKDGFIGFGTYWMLAVICFATNQTKRSIGYYLLAPVVAFVGLSVFVNYMASRTEFRQLVWVQQVGVGDRITHLMKMFENFEFVDFSNSTHEAAINGRLNQNIIVGMAVERLESGAVGFASGATFGAVLLGLIPRAFWPEKPAVGGGGSVVKQFTGLEFAAGTSVGAGQVLEFYANFGTWGVIGGFLLYGWLIGKIDKRVIDSLSRGDQRGFVLWFLIGLAMLQPGGNLLEIVVTVASSAVAGTGIGYLLNRRPVRPDMDAVAESRMLVR